LYDDAVWRGAPVMHQFRQFDPAEDGEPSFRTEVKAAYDDRNLYVLVRAFDPHPDSIVSLLSRRDVRTSSDQIKIIVDAYHDRRTGVEFAVSPAGVKRDASIYNDYVEDMSWDGVWDAAPLWTHSGGSPSSAFRSANFASPRLHLTPSALLCGATYRARTSG